MTILSIGSVNIDHVYRLAHLPAPGETLADLGYAAGLGGKGANHALAAAHGGARVCHAGAIGAEGGWCRARLDAAGIDTTDLVEVEAATGHAIIFVDAQGENSIVIHPGANRALPPALIDRAVARRSPGDWVLMQNETNLVVEAARAARAAGLRVAYAAAPFDPDATAALIGLVDLMAMNAVEAAQLAAHTGHPVESLDVPAMLITRGAEGASYRGPEGDITVPAFKVNPVDTTGAGDTFFGTFLAGLDQDLPERQALTRAAAAAALQVTRPGAVDAIPVRAEVDRFLREAGGG